MADLYLCAQLVTSETGVQSCIRYVVYEQQSNFITELSSLTYAQVGQILSYTVSLFALAWVYRHLGQFASKP